MASILEFLTSGRLGGVHLGLRPEQVTGLLGPADDQSVRRKPVYILRYGAVEFAFKPLPDSRDSELISTAIYFAQPGREMPPTLRPADRLLSKETTGREFRQFLEQEGIAVRSEGQSDEEYLTLDSGASVVFVGGKLHSIHYARREEKPERKQMTVSLPEEAVQRLRQRAREERVSVHDLLEKMIRAGA